MQALPTLVHRTLDLYYRSRHRASRSSVVRLRLHHQWIPRCPGAASSCAISACHLAVTSVLSPQTKCASSLFARDQMSQTQPLGPSRGARNWLTRGG